jgi:hypothetical protein
LSIFSPRSRDIVVEYTDPEPLFHKYGIEAELERLHSRHVPLASGGSLVIDQTEALVAIDVNSGRFRTEDDAETTAYKINCEAADEIPRQLRLRDLGGVVVCDFIDMRLEKHRRSIERRLIENLKKHKERAKVLRTSAVRHDRADAPAAAGQPDAQRVSGLPALPRHRPGEDGRVGGAGRDAAGAARGDARAYPHGSRSRCRRRWRTCCRIANGS